MSGPRTNAAFYAAPVSEFLAASDEEAYAPLAAPKGYTLAPEQLSAWHLQLPLLRAALRGLARVPQEQGPVPFGDEAPAPWIHLEFDIPRLGRRVDAVLVTPTCVIPIEFKVGAKKFERLDYEQAWDYGLDLKNFHAPSHAAPIFPILCATEARDSDRRWKPPHADGVRPPFCCNGESLGRAIRLALGEEKVSATLSAAETVADTFSGLLTPSTWGTGSYSPTPTIIEAARSLYARHTVHDITRSDAGAVNLAATSGCIERIIAAAKAGRRKAIVFVTGVPGAGKTLVGLNVATRHGERSDAAHAVFLSGNGPLVAVLREALARDDLERRKKEKVSATLSAAETVADTFSGPGTLTTDPSLHLSTSMRSFRAESLSRFVKALLDGEAEAGRELFESFREQYPIVLTRSMRAARRWIRRQRRGTERAGLVASSSAQRLKPHAIDIRVNIDPVHWFLSPAKDTRSSLYLEDAATEFQVQGLELDWTIVTWDADLRWSGDDWSYHSFRAAQKNENSRTDVKKPERRQYLKNAYRVLLTRARRGPNATRRGARGSTRG
jgi:hypothetical protein